MGLVVAEKQGGTVETRSKRISQRTRRELLFMMRWWLSEAANVEQKLKHAADGK